MCTNGVKPFQDQRTGLLTKEIGQHKECISFPCKTDY